MKTHVLESVALAITPLSPVHIGTGEDYEPTNYVMEDEILFAFTSEALSDWLLPSQRQELLNLVMHPARRPEELIQKVQGFFYHHRKLFAAISTRQVPVSPGVFKLYQSRVGQTANRESGGRGVINQLAIERTFFNPFDQQPVIPGSSIKGAIRTALLDDVNGGKALTQRERTFLQDKRPSERAKANEALQERLFKYRREVEGTSKKLLQCDPMRLVQVADTSYQFPGPFSSEIRFAVDRKKKEILKNGKLVQSQAEARNLYQLLECLPPRYRSFKSALVIFDLGEIDHVHKTPAKELRWKVMDLAAACNCFYRKRLADELKILKQRRYLNPSWERLAEAILDGDLAKRLKEGKAFLLRVGRHSGAESVTLDGVRSIKILEGKGADGKQRYSYQPEAKTIWLAASDAKAQSDLLPFGWVLVEIQPDGEWPELQQLLKPLRADETKLNEQLAALAKERAQIRQKKQEADEQARLKAEAEAQAVRQEAERQARLAAMSPEEQALEEFRVYYEAQKATGRYQAGGEFDRRRLEFFKQALQWQDPAHRKQAAALIRKTIQEWTGWPGKKERKQEFREGLAELEQERRS